MLDAGTRRTAPEAGSAHFSGVLPTRLLRFRRPVWWQEVAILIVGYWIYSLGRNSIPEQASIATRHGLSIQHLQDIVGLNFELSINEWVGTHEWLAQILNYYYATLHFVVTIGVLVWMFVRRPHVYRGARTVLFTLTLIALAGFALYPVAPPRLLPGYEYIDTVIKFHTWGSLADPEIAAHSNQYAAMPSLHIGWALWAGISVFMCARSAWARTLGLLYPFFTLIVIIGTANHFIVDAVGGVAIVAFAFGIQAVLSGHGAYTPPWDARDFGRPDPPLPNLRPSRRSAHKTAVRAARGPTQKTAQKAAQKIRR
ncbi:MAG: phosphatase PAP2 family protein [Jatrophihabitantaceae bacterium]